ncbi:hypothetical protein H4S07_003760, partial [Coemansia furcata]
RQGSETAGFTTEGHLLPRRHTIVEGQTADDSELHDIDAFIRMVDARRPLGSYSRKDSAKHVLSNDPYMSGTATGPVSGRVPRVAGGESLAMYQGILNQFSTMSQDMQSSVILSDKPLASQARHMPLPLPPMSEDAEAEDGVVEELSSSPFRRMAMPNPLRGSDRPASSRPVSMVSVGTPNAGLQASQGSLDSSSVAAAIEHPQRRATVASILEDGHSLDKLQRAFGGLVIESQTDFIQQQQPYVPDTHAAHLSTLDLPINTPGVARPHIRSAAPGLDARQERPLPQPVSIPYTTYSAPRRTAAKQQPPPPAYLEFERPEDNDIYADVRPSEARMRGKSQPLLHAAELSLPVAPRIATPQPPSHSQTQAQLTAGIYRPAPSLASSAHRHIQAGLGGPSKRLSPELGPLSHRSDFISSNHQLGALLSMADKPSYARDSPRSTPTTPMLGTLPILQHGINAIAETSDAERQSDRLRSNFPPLSFIVPRHRMDPYASPPHPKESVGSSQYTVSNRPQVDNDDDDDELIFQMESSTC